MFAWIQTALKRGELGLPEDLSERIKAADIFPRPSDPESGQRIYVGGFRGSFIFTRDEAEKRILSGWPELNKDQVRRAVAFLEARVRNVMASQHRGVARRKNWVNDY